MSYDLRATSYNKRLNVLYLIWSLGLGGAERVIINLVKGLDKDKFKPVICCLNAAGQFAFELENQGIKVIALNKKGKFDISVIGKLIAVIKENNIDIVHTHLWGANFWGRIAAKKAGVKVIIATEHNEDVWKPELFFILDRWLARSTDKIIAVSNKVKEFYVGKGIPEEKIEVIYNGVDIEMSQVSGRRSHIREEFGIKEDETVLAIIGRLVPQKGHRYLFEALGSLNGQYKVKLLVVGDGPLLESLKSQVASLRLQDKVIFAGLRKDVPNILKNIDMLVMPSLREGLPMVALEAMATGVPIVATQVGGTPEVIIEGECGLLVKSKNHHALRSAIERIISDTVLKNCIIDNAKKRIREEFKVEKMLSKTQDVYEKLYAAKNEK